MASSEEEERLQRKITRELERQAELRIQISTDAKKYLEALDDLKLKQKVINDLEKQQEKLVKSMTDLEGDALKEAQVKLKILKDQTDEIKKQKTLIEGAVAGIDARKLGRQELLTKGAAAIGKAVVTLDQTLMKGYDKLKSLGLFEMDKAIKRSALEMGVLSKEAVGYRTTVKEVAKRTAMMGISVKELTELQATYTEELGRNVMFSEQGMKAMADIAASTTLGTQGTAKMAADMENVGLSAERVGEFVNTTLNKTHKMGLNATKTLKNLTGGMKLLNQYNFKDGSEGLAKMARTVTKLGVDMKFAAGFADKLWNVEGAVEMSAQMQVMGGEFAKMADPFHLMYMARNDLNGLTEELGKAAEASVQFNKKTGEFDITAMEMQRLKILADQMGVSYDEIATAGKNAAKFTKIKSQLSFTVGGGKEGEEIKEFLTSKAFLDKSGKASIKLGSDTKLLSQLKSTDKETIRAMIKDEENMEKRAVDSKAFDESLTNVMNGMKVSLMPIVEMMSKELIPKLQALSKRFVEEGWDKKIEFIATKIGDLITFFGGWVLDNPIKSAFIYGVSKFTGFLFEKGNWFTNGLALSAGFKAGTGGAAGPATAAFAKPGVATGLGALGGVAGAALYGYTDANAEKGSTGNYLGKGVGGALTGAGIGASIGSIIPILGTAIGAALGGVIGGGIGVYNAYQEDPTRPMNDGLFNSPVHDAKIGSIRKPRQVSSDFSKKRGIVQGGKITPIDNKDDLLAMKQGGPVDRAVNQGNQKMNVDFGEITINGRIEIVSPGAPGLSIDLMKDPQFKRDIARVVSSEVEKNRNGGKNKV